MKQMLASLGREAAATEARFARKGEPMQEKLASLAGGPMQQKLASLARRVPIQQKLASLAGGFR